MTKKVVTPAPPDLEDIALFRLAVSDAIPLPIPDRISPSAPVIPVIRQRPVTDEHEAITDYLSDAPLEWDESIESGAGPGFLRQGLSRQVMKKLRRGHWAVQDYLDLHGMNRNEAREALGAFLAATRLRGRRCVHIIHGKGLGSKNGEPILKMNVKRWLASQEAVLAYCEAPQAQGGAGAMLVLLRA